MLDKFCMPLSDGSDGSKFFNRGLEYEHNGDIDMAKTSYRCAIQCKNANAAINLGVLCVDGTPEERNEAESLFTLAAVNKCNCGYRNLGYIYALGLNVEKDKKKAAEFYEKAAKLGNIKAQCNIAVMYRYGSGVDIDLVKAFDWYLRSASAGYFRAQATLGDMFYNGEGTEVDRKKALEWYTKAASNGSARGMYRLALMYLNGEDVNEDRDRACGLLNAAIELGYSKAMFVMGDILEKNGSQLEAMNLYISGAAKNESRCIKRLNELDIQLPEIKKRHA